MLQEARFSSKYRYSLKVAVLIGLLAAAFIYNAIIRWFPFPPGRSQNDLTGIENNIQGIIFNLMIYAIILLISLSYQLYQRLNIRIILLFIYCFYIIVQSFFRNDVVLELFRSVSLMLLLVSADRFGIIASRNQSGIFLKISVFTLVFTVYIGLFIGFFVSPGSINWGILGSGSFENVNRAEFFFFYIPPFITMAFILAYLRTLKRPFLDLTEKIFFGFTLMLLIFMMAITFTRTFVFSVIFILFVYLLYKFKYFFIIFLLFASFAVFTYNPDFFYWLLEHTRIFSTDPLRDFSNGRLQLNEVNLNSFLASPIFGNGSEMARLNIDASNSIAKTEHGYSIHLASYGLFSIFFFLYILFGAINCIKNIYFITINRLVDEKNVFLVIVSSLGICFAFLGFVGGFGSSSAFTDWLAIAVLSIGYNIQRHIL